MVKRQNISSGSQFEKLYGYSRAVKAGDTLYISGTIGMDYAAGKMPEDAVGQVRQIIKNFEMPLAAAGGSLKDIVQITTYVTTPEVFKEVGPELGVIFGDIQPTNAALVVAFPVPGVLVEISATAVIGCE
ncbi:enamine deaminase RidA (YjgF/YER057c/UK114 family) [Ancylobacter aquaticus]|uniref:Enamine deaminase RidA (YjgF/YER057c/UK114 family) n=1 Tax=Ancylobacter aquaticus TaxID=100 RepID=A0A4R1I2X9_ANCAQ|nr:Rid family hydrolase [Ancylobacter aquaticus]TCK28303.1 enamine deaminase RidA (YjgF/YER057c/UK114 family) [Ancylobacter aquaticus]